MVGDAQEPAEANDTPVFLRIHPKAIVLRSQRPRFEGFVLSIRKFVAWLNQRKGRVLNCGELPE
jgi:hypothetical protein